MSEPPDGDLVLRDDAGTAVLELIGEQTIERAGELQATLSQLVDQGRPIAVDLTAATLLDSMALAALLTAAERAAFRGGELVIVLTDETPRIVGRALRVAGVDGSVLIFATRQAALAHLARLGIAKPG